MKKERNGNGEKASPFLFVSGQKGRGRRLFFLWKRAGSPLCFSPFPNRNGSERKRKKNVGAAERERNATAQRKEDVGRDGRATGTGRKKNVGEDGRKMSARIGTGTGTEKERRRAEGNGKPKQARGRERPNPNGNGGAASPPKRGRRQRRTHSGRSRTQPRNEAGRQRERHGDSLRQGRKGRQGTPTRRQGGGGGKRGREGDRIRFSIRIDFPVCQNCARGHFPYGGGLYRKPAKPEFSYVRGL